MIDTGNLTRTLAEESATLFDELEGMIDRHERLGFVFGLLKGLLGKNSLLYAASDLPGFQQLLEKRDNLYIEALKLFEKKLSVLLNLVVSCEKEERHTLYYLLARYIAETECSFMLHLRFVGVTLWLLDDSDTRNLAQQAACRHDFGRMTGHRQGEAYDCSKRPPYESLRRKIERKREGLSHESVVAYQAICDLYRPRNLEIRREELASLYKRALDPLPLSLEVKNDLSAFMLESAIQADPLSDEKLITQSETLTRSITDITPKKG